MNDHSCFMSYKFVGDDMMGYISHQNFLISWVLGFWPYHAKWGDVLSNALWILHLWTSADVSDAQNDLFSCGLLSRSFSITILCMLLLCLSIFPLRKYELPPVFSIYIWTIQQVSWWHLSSLTSHHLHKLLSIFMVVVNSSVLLVWRKLCGQGIVWIQYRIPMAFYSLHR